jgi:P pilus assembly chaperone PapD
MILALLFIPLLLLGVQMTPMIAEVNPFKKKSNFQITNYSDKYIAVEFTILKIQDTTIKETRVETEDFLVYPSQFILPPKSSKNVRTHYINNTIQEQEQVYRTIARELDIEINDTNQSKKKSGITFKFIYEGLIFVGTDDFKSNLKITSITQKNDIIKMTIENTGNKSDIITTNNYEIKAIKNNKSYTLKKELSHKIKFRRILPFSKHTYTFSISKTFPEIKGIDTLVLKRIQ